MEIVELIRDSRCRVKTREEMEKIGEAAPWPQSEYLKQFKRIIGRAVGLGQYSHSGALQNGVLR